MILRLLSALIACFVVAVAFVAWQLSQGPVSLDFLTPYLEDAMRDADQDWRVDVGEVVLMNDFRVHARAVSLLDQQGKQLLQVPDLVVRPSLQGLLHGFAAVGAIEITGAEASVIRRADGTFGISVAGAPPTQPGDPAASNDFVDELLRPAGSETAIGFLHRVRLKDARINVDDLQSGTTLSVQGLDIGLVRSTDGQELTLSALLQAGKDRGQPTKLEATLTVHPNGNGFALQGQAKAAPIDISRLALYWPQNAAAGARGWVTKNVPKGRVPEVVADIALASDSGADFRLTTLGGKFQYEGLEVRWSDEAPPVTGIGGTATFDRGSMHFLIKRGTSAGIEIAAAKIDIAGLDVDKERLELTIEGKGPLSSVVKLFPAKVTLPFQMDGDTTLNVSSKFPLRAKLSYSSDVDLRVDARPTSLKVRHANGHAVVGGQLRYSKPPKAEGTLTADLDLSEAQVNAGDFHWTQPAKSAGKVAFRMQPEVRPLKIDPLHVDFRDLEAGGSVVIIDDGASGSVNLTNVSYAKTNIDRFEAQWTPSAHKARVGKGTLDLQPFLKESGSQTNDPAAARPVDLDLNIDGGLRISLDRNSWMENVNATLVRRNGEFERIDVRAELPRKLWSAGQPASAAAKTFWLKYEPSGPGKRLDAAAPDFGALLKAVDASNGVRGGTLVISGRADTTDSGGNVVRSHVKVTDFVIAQAPLAVRILSVAALDRFVGTLKGEGLHFDSLKGIVTARGDRYGLDNFRAYGSSVGWTAGGWVDIGTDELSIDGAVIPAYAANRVMRNVPLLGTLLAGSDSRGLIAINYKVRGALKDPKVSANPLSALTPGILRGLWEIGE